MSWNYRRPMPDQFDSEEEYEEAVSSYDNAEAMYIDACLERERER